MTVRKGLPSGRPERTGVPIRQVRQRPDCTRLRSRGCGFNRSLARPLRRDQRRAGKDAAGGKQAAIGHSRLDRKSTVTIGSAKSESLRRPWFQGIHRRTNGARSGSRRPVRAFRATRTFDWFPASASVGSGFESGTVERGGRGEAARPPATSRSNSVAGRKSRRGEFGHPSWNSRSCRENPEARCRS
jgi:hypothetical protein